MLSGKAVSRAVRAHLLIDAALNTMAASQMCDVPIPCISPASELDTNDGGIHMKTIFAFCVNGHVKPCV